VSRDFFVKATHPVTALNPCYANFDGSLVGRSGSYSTNFSYDAFRTAGNWSMDWSWWAKDPRQRELSDKLQAFLNHKERTTAACSPSTESSWKPGTPRAWVAINAVASLSATHPRARKFCGGAMEYPTPEY